MARLFFSIKAFAAFYRLAHNVSKINLTLFESIYILKKIKSKYSFNLFRFMAIKNSLTWWYHRKIKRNEVKAEKLKKDKVSLLEKVMETETYKVAKEILDKYGSEMPGQARMNAVRCPESFLFTIAFWLSNLKYYRRSHSFHCFPVTQPWKFKKVFFALVQM